MELYHVLNRGVEKRNIFLDDRDRFRFVHGLGLFNTARPANNTTYLLEHEMEEINDIRGRYGKGRVVNIHGWCIMKNHYHLLLSELVDNGITTFIRKLNVGYAKYFNARYRRSGYVFQGRTKKVHIHSETHFLHILHYIHLNPLDYVSGAQSWRSARIVDSAKAKDQLRHYRWSSYADYCGRRNFPSILTTDFFKASIGNIEKETTAYLGSMSKHSNESFPVRFLE